MCLNEQNTGFKSLEGGVCKLFYAEQMTVAQPKSVPSATIKARWPSREKHML